MAACNALSLVITPVNVYLDGKKVERRRCGADRRPQSERGKRSAIEANLQALPPRRKVQRCKPNEIKDQTSTNTENREMTSAKKIIAILLAVTLIPAGFAAYRQHVQSIHDKCNKRDVAINADGTVSTLDYDVVNNVYHERTRKKPLEINWQ